MKLMIAGGGTGGHIYPGIALAEEHTTRDRRNQVLFVGTSKGLETKLVPRAGFELRTIDVEGLKGKGLRGLLRALWLIPRSLFQSLRIIRAWRPDMALGVGGYASGPVILGAWLLGIPSGVEEQNAYPGLTNRLLARFVSAVFVSFDAARRFLPRRKVYVLGTPIRRGFLDNFIAPAPKARDGFTVLVMGGSQGAHAVNLLAVDAAQYLKDAIPNLRIVHQTGSADEDMVRGRYATLGVTADVHPFIEDMGEAYRGADLVVCRAGATTVAELSVCRKASILIPYPHAANNHQVMNAAALVETKAAIMARQDETTGESIARLIIDLHHDPERLTEMSRRSGGLGRPEAAREIIDACFELVHARGKA